MQKLVSNPNGQTKHQRFETQIQIVQDLNGSTNKSNLPNSEAKVHPNKKVPSDEFNHSNSNQSSVARFGFQSSNLHVKNSGQVQQPKKLSFSISKPDISKNPAITK